MKISDLRIFRLDQRYPHGKVINAVLVFVETDEGFIGFGSAHHPIPDEFIDESLRFLRDAKPAIIGMDPFDIEGILDVFSKVPPQKNAARSALDIACHDIMGKSKGKPIYQLLSGKIKPYIVPTVVAVYLHDDPVETTKTLMKKYMPNGLKILQIHIGNNHRINKKRIEEVSRIFPGKLTLHAGARLKNPKEDIAFLNEIHEKYQERILMVVQPAPIGDYSILKLISDKSEIPVFAHYFKTIDEIQKIIDTEAAKGVWVHTYRMGGFHLCSKIADLVKKNKLGLHLGNGGACGITTTAGSHLTAGTKDALVTAVIDDLKYPYLRITSNESMPELRDGARIPSERYGLGLALKDGFRQILENKIKLSTEG